MFTPDQKYCLESDNAIFATSDVKIRKETIPSPHVRGKRQAVELFSNNSRKRLLEVCRNCGHFIKSQLCLTYHFSMPASGKDVKRQLNQFLVEMREKYSGIKYIWVLEFQKRGVPHFHVFTDREHTDKDFHMWSAKTWNRILGESREHLIFQINSSNFMKWNIGSGNYLSKEYLGKEDQKTVPEQYESVGRFWGNSRNMIPFWTAIASSVDVSLWAYNKAVRIVTKYRERVLKKFGIKINYRQKNRTYTLKNCTNIFIKTLEYYENEKNKCHERAKNKCLPLPTL